MRNANSLVQVFSPVTKSTSYDDSRYIYIYIIWDMIQYYGTYNIWSCLRNYYNNQISINMSSWKCFCLFVCWFVCLGFFFCILVGVGEVSPKMNRKRFLNLKYSQWSKYHQDSSRLYSKLYWKKNKCWYYKLCLTMSNSEMTKKDFCCPTVNSI